MLHIYFIKNVEVRDKDNLFLYLDSCTETDDPAEAEYIIVSGTMYEPEELDAIPHDEIAKAGTERCMGIIDYYANYYLPDFRQQLLKLLEANNG